VVDDNASALEILSGYLANFGLDAVIASSGEKAIDILKESGPEKFSLMLLDWMMPGMDGVQTLEKIKTEFHLEHTLPIIMVSAYELDEVKKRCIELGAVGFVTKPVTPSGLYNEITRVMRPLTHIAVRSVPGAVFSGIPDLDGRKILLVEDNAINREVASEMLKKTGAGVDFAKNGISALDRLRSARYDLVLMDVQMPEMDGLEATRKLRLELGLSDVPVVAMTAYAMSGDREMCIEAGMNDYVSKPIEPQRFYTLLSKWLPGPKTPMEGIETSEAHGRIASIPGIDMERGMSQVMNNEELLLKLIAEFYRQYKDAPARIEDLTKNNNRAELARLIHGIKGTAGTIGAVKIQNAAMIFEAVIKNDDEDLSSGMEIMNSAIKELMQGPLYEDFVSGRMTADAQGGEDDYDKGICISRMKELALCLKTRNYSALEIYNNCSSFFAYIIGDDIIELDGYMRSLKFDEALELLEKTIERMINNKNDEKDINSG
jgi:CheY-like chemotaxis protein